MIVKNTLHNNWYLTGVDERIHLDADGYLKYGVPPVNDDVVNRGSCTCNPLNSSTLERIDRLIDGLDGKQEWVDLIDQQSESLKAQVSGIECDYDIYYGPSGTDLVYYPIIFSSLMHPEKPILNIITCLEELGSGTKLASEGKYHAIFNQFDEPIPKEGPVVKNLEIKPVFFNSRTMKGEIIDAANEIKKVVAKSEGYSVIINLVVGSKSGIEDNLNLIDQFPDDDIIWNVDMCQFRHKPGLINDLLKKGVMVMTTGSKFYQASPFCGATFVPRRISEELHLVKDWSKLLAYGSVFSKYDFPKGVREECPFPDQINPGTVLRWNCAIHEIEKFNLLDMDLVNKCMDGWNEAVCDELSKYSCFKLMPDQDQTNQTIVSFKLKDGDEFLSGEASAAFYRSFVQDDYKDEIGYKSIHIGQPVYYMNGTFLRLAIGSKTVAEFVANNETEFKLDRKIVQLLASRLKEFCETH